MRTNVAYELVVKKYRGGRNIRLINPDCDYDSILVLVLQTDAEADTAAAIFREFLANPGHSDAWPPAPVVVWDRK